MCLSLLVGIENGAGGYEDQSVTSDLSVLDVCFVFPFSSRLLRRALGFYARYIGRAFCGRGKLEN